MAIFPELQIQPGSGLSIKWAEYISKAGSTSDASFGVDGVALGMSIIINWEDIETGIQEILGYSYRDLRKTTPVLRRVLPMQHPMWGQLWATRISKVHNIKFTGKQVGLASPVTGNTSRTISTYQCALLTVQFTRPNYAILEDDSIVDGEWERYTDRLWKPSVQMISREGRQFAYREGQPATLGRVFGGSVGQKLGKVSLTRRWYQIPEDGIYNSEGYPAGLCGSVTSSIIPLASVNKTEFLGMPAGTLLYVGPEIIPRPLQIPPELMGIVGEDTQLQYDVVFNFELFLPPKTSSTVMRGHNCFPWSTDGNWYACSQYSSTIYTITGATSGTPIVITTAISHPYNDGDIVQVSSVGGNTAANGTWMITYISPTTFSLNNSIWAAGAYTSGGAAVGGAPAFRPYEFANLFQII